jgi:hypothetical protein
MAKSVLSIALQRGPRPREILLGNIWYCCLIYAAVLSLPWNHPGCDVNAGSPLVLDVLAAVAPACLVCKKRYRHRASRKNDKVGMEPPHYSASFGPCKSHMLHSSMGLEPMC